MTVGIAEASSESSSCNVCKPTQKQQHIFHDPEYQTQAGRCFSPCPAGTHKRRESMYISAAQVLSTITT